MIKYNSPVILTFSLICTLVFVLDRYLGMEIMQYFLVGNHIQWSNPLSIPTLFTHAIGHGSIQHLLGNLTFILLLGPIIEEKYGSFNTLLMMFLTALITGILNVTFFDVGLYGASGIVFMLILLAPFTNSTDGKIPLTFILVAILFLGKEVKQSLADDQISQFAHIIGGLCGAAFGFLGRGRKKSDY